MIDSLTIFTKNGVVLYHYSQPQTKGILTTSSSGSNLASYSTNNDKNTAETTTTSDTISSEVVELINAFISNTLLDHNRLSKVKQIKRTTLSNNGATNGISGTSSSSSVSATVVEWEEGTTEALQFSDDEDKKDWMVVALYPEVVLRHSSHLDSSKWIRYLLRSVLKEYALFYDSVQASSSASQSKSDVDENSRGGNVNELMALPSPPDKTLFDATFRALLRRSETMGRRAQAGSTAATGGRDVSESFNQMDDNVDDIDENDDPAMEENENNDVSADNDRNGDDDGPIDVAAGIARLKERQRRKNNPHSATATEGKAPKKGKEKTVWHDGTAKVTKSALANLDRSKDQNKSSSALDGIDAAVAEDSRALAEARAAYLPSSGETPLWEEEDMLDDYDDEDDDDGEDVGGGGWGSSLKGLFDQMSGNKVLTDSDLDAPLDDMQKMLTSKNVANDIAKEICDGVRSKLVGKKMQSFMRVKTAVRHALEASIEKILRPAHNRDVDLLRSVVTKREKGKGFFGSSKSKPTRPYVIVMIGINGVGKSTSLAKIAYYLKSNGCSPLLAACDTFRSGAVEQLNVHAKCLDVPLYHKGYAKDPSAVAKAAIDHAAQEGHDVVLVDTAGRMQNNVPLMKALSKLVVENDPDLVLFVCEALVGNDGMDQLFMFDKALRSGGHSRQIDGIVLTKFDTVSDKVGAALTMTHITGAPVVFVGTGQKYNHLKKLGAQSVIKSLFS